jgi:hypothetical protein
MYTTLYSEDLKRRDTSVNQGVGRRSTLQDWKRVFIWVHYNSKVVLYATLRDINSAGQPKEKRIHHHGI